MAQAELSGAERIHLIEPLDVVDFHNLAARSYLIMTDSGGVQEEAPSLGKPVLVLRDETERPEGVKAGTLKLVGTDPKVVTQAMETLLTDQAAYRQMADAKNPYGDGHAAERILKIIEDHQQQLWGWTMETGFKGFVKQLIHRFANANVNDSAAVLSYYMLLSIFPIMLIAGNLIAFLHFNTNSVLSYVEPVLPEPVFQTLAPIIRSFLEQGSTGLCR